MPFFTTLIAATAAVLAVASAQNSTHARTCALKGAVVVDQSGQNGYVTVQAGIDALSTNATGLQSLFIYPGEYNEQVASAQRARCTILPLMNDPVHRTQECQLHRLWLHNRRKIL